MQMVNVWWVMGAPRLRLTGGPLKVVLLHDVGVACGLGTVPLIGDRGMVELET